MLLPRDSFTQVFLGRDAFTQKIHTDARVLLHTDALTQRCCYRMLVHAPAFTQGFF